MAFHGDNVDKMAKEAFIDDDFEAAVRLYSQAIDLNPTHPQLYLERSQAYFKLDNFNEAVADANRAIVLDPSMAKAYLRKGIACLKLEEYQIAKTAFAAGAALAPDDSRFTKFINECEAHIAAENESFLNPSVEKLNVCTISDDTNSGSSTDLYVHLNTQIIPTKCRYEVLSTKIEIHLSKAETIQWTSLEYTNDVTVAQKINISTSVQRPSYPSSKPKKIDWDKLEAKVKKEEKDEKLDGDAALNKFFRDIYSSADEDMRRAMQKSFIESNGTALSTNWQEVGSKKVDATPPDGMEMKKWEY